MHHKTFYKEYKFIGEKTLESLFNYGLCLPFDTKILDKEIRFEILKGNEFFSL